MNEASEAENDEVAFTDGDTDEVEITEENPTDVSSQDETDENAEIEFTEAEDIFSENEVAVQTGETITASGTLATGVNWSDFQMPEICSLAVQAQLRRTMVRITIRGITGFLKSILYLPLLYTIFI